MKPWQKLRQAWKERRGEEREDASIRSRIRSASSSSESECTPLRQGLLRLRREKFTFPEKLKLCRPPAFVCDDAKGKVGAYEKR